MRETSLRPSFVLLLSVAAVLALPGCLVVAGAGGAAAGYQLTQEESFSDQIQDKAVRALVRQSWSEVAPELTENLDATVYQGKVLLTGRVPKEEWHAEAVKRTWKVDGVKGVFDEIQVGPATHFVDDAHDGFITSRLRTEIIADTDVKSINYTITTSDGIVYLMGSARTQDELSRVIDRARNLSGVRRVVSFVQIREGVPHPAAAASAPRPPAAGSSAPEPLVSSAAPSPNGPPPAGYVPPPPSAKIEVTPLQ